MITFTLLFLILLLLGGIVWSLAWRENAETLKVATLSYIEELGSKKADIPNILKKFKNKISLERLVKILENLRRQELIKIISKPGSPCSLHALTEAGINILHPTAPKPKSSKEELMPLEIGTNNQPCIKLKPPPKNMI